MPYVHRDSLLLLVDKCVDKVACVLNVNTVWLMKINEVYNIETQKYILFSMHKANLSLRFLKLKFERLLNKCHKATLKPLINEQTKKTRTH